jgi:hypothetical protein
MSHWPRNCEHFHVCLSKPVLRKRLLEAVATVISSCQPTARHRDAGDRWLTEFLMSKSSRIARNELRAIRTLRACVDAQRDYYDLAQEASCHSHGCAEHHPFPGPRNDRTGPRVSRPLSDDTNRPAALPGYSRPRQKYID